MVIRVKNDGSIRLTREVERHIEAMQLGRESWRASFRNARRAHMRYYRWCCMCNESAIQEHILRDGAAFDSKHHPPDGRPSCICCWPEWLFDEEDINHAIREIIERETK